MVGPGPDGGQHFVRFGSGEDEDQVLRRFLDDLQQGVETLSGDHVGLVDDEHPVPRLRGHVESLVPEVPGVIDAAVTGRVEFHHIQRPGALRGECDAGRALTARVRGGAVRAVQRTGENPCGGSLSAAAGAGEQVRVIDPAGGQRGAQRVGDMLLTHDLGEGCGPVLPVQGERHEPRLRQGADSQDRAAHCYR